MAQNQFDGGQLDQIGQNFESLDNFEEYSINKINSNLRDNMMAQQL